METINPNAHTHRELNNMMLDFLNNENEESFEVARDEWSIKQKQNWLMDNGYELWDDDGKKIV